MKIEEKFLSIILNNPELYDDFSQYDNKFKDAGCRILYEILQEIYKKYNKIEKDLIVDHIQTANSFDVMKFYKIYDSECFPDNYRSYLALYLTEGLKDDIKRYINQNLIDKNFIDIKYDIEGILNNTSNLYTDDIKDSKADCRELINNLNNDVLPDRIYSSIFSLDNNQRGYSKTDFVLWGATESTGKTSLIINSIPKQLQKGLRIGFISCETKMIDLRNLIACNMAEIDSNKVINRNMNENEKRLYLAALNMLYEQPLFIVDKLNDWFDIKQAIKILKRTYNIDIVYIDYLHYIRHKKIQDQYSRLEEISKGVKSSCTELEIPHVCIVILNKTGDTDEPPQCRHIKGNNDIQYDADIIILLKTFQDNIEGDYNRRIVDFYFRKNRNGKKGYSERMLYLPHCRKYERFIPE